ncbi:MAG: DUF4384 domain-containing protein [Cyanobacteria bacterium SZAS LIN-2]|nr:DUF4384 domain-containing protein [Cyanobacteria bacterium SZAS LIN-2]
MALAIFGPTAGFFVGRHCQAVGARSQIESTVSSGDREGLRAQFQKQMDLAARGDKVNLGLAYWIELNRGGHFYRTSNMASFKSGDQIRFHVLPNADGYAYIVMRQGTKGTKAVLFPLSSASADNFVQCGRECVVPSDGALEFDQVPGSEQVGLLLSRNQIDPGKYLIGPAVADMPKAVAVVEENLSDLEKSYDAIFGGAKSMGRVNSGALEVLSVDSDTRLPVAEKPEQILASPSTSIAVNADPDAVVTVDFALRHQ